MELETIVIIILALCMVLLILSNRKLKSEVEELVYENDTLEDQLSEERSRSYYAKARFRAQSLHDGVSLETIKKFSAKAMVKDLEELFMTVNKKSERYIVLKVREEIILHAKALGVTPSSIYPNGTLTSANVEKRLKDVYVAFHVSLYENEIDKELK